MNARSVRNWLAALAVVSGAGISTAMAQTAAASAPEEKKDAVKLEKFEVTGSRVKRLDTETPAPVVSYSTKDIEAKGYTNIGDFIQSLPFNTGSANSIYQTASFTRGAATANPRGLGSQRFLVLIDGRRGATYALTNSGGRSVFDFNSLPAAAIESVEFLKDGASAIYGSDAITGVMNIKMKKNFNGLSLTGYYGNTLDHDTGTKMFSAVAGSSLGKTKVMTAFSYQDANSNFLHDYGVTTTDYSNTGRGINQNSTSNFPANLTLTRAQATALGFTIPNATSTSWSFVVSDGKPVNNPTLANFVAAPASPTSATTVAISNTNRYNFAETYQRYPAYTYISSYTQMEHEFTENVKAFGSVTFADNFTYYAFTPGVISYSTEGLTLPVANPYNPFGIALTSLSARANFGPVRKFDTESVAANFLGGFRGTIMDKWDWETALSYGTDRATTISRNAIRATTYQAALNGTLTGFTGKFLNPFGYSDGGLTNALFTTSTATAKSEITTWDASISGTVLHLPGGEIGVAGGLEARNEVLTTNPDTAAYLGSGGGQPLTGERDIKSAYVEVTAPVFKWLEFQVAARYEDYSDFGDTTKPKYGVKIKLPENKIANILLRGSYSESFQAPALGLLYQSQTVAFSSGVLQDPLRPQDPPVQQRIITGGNPNLLPEFAETKYAGIVVDIPAVKDLSFTVDWFNIRIDQVIVTPSATFLLSERGRQQFPNAIVRDNTLSNPGPILYIQSVPSNNPAAYQIYKGIDYGVNYRLRNTRVGDFNFGLEATQILEIGSDSGLGGGYFDNTGLYNNPEWRGQASVGWNRKDWSATMNADYIGSYHNDGYVAGGWEENSYTLYSASVSYRGLWGTTMTLGCNNLFDNLPPFNGYDTAGFDPNTYSGGALGRFVYVRVRKDF